MDSSASILFCNCAYADTICGQARSAVGAALENSRLSYRTVNDLCLCSKQRQPFLRDFAAQNSGAVIACYPRAVKWLFHWAGADLNEDAVTFFNMRTQKPDEIMEGLKAFPGNDRAKHVKPEDSQDDWIPWFPVIDYERCRNCKQCLNFCLFGVYRQSEEGRVVVHNPANCKTNCPACARMCPQQAIIFPKYEHEPFNGAPVATEESADKAVIGPKTDIYEMIRKRCPKPMETLKKMAEELDVPQEVLDSLEESDLRQKK